MVNIKVNGKLSDKAKTQLQILEKLSNVKGDINLDGSIDEETLKYIVLQLTLLDKVKKLVPKDGKDGKDGANGLPGKDGRDGIPGKNGRDGEDGIDGVDGIDGKDGKDGKDGQDGKDGESLDFKWDGTKLGIRKEGGKWEYKDLQGKGKGGGSFYGGITPPVIMDQRKSKVVTGTYTITDLDYKIIVDATDGDITLTLPNAATIPDKEYIITRKDGSANTVTIQTQGAQLLFGESSEVLYQYETLVFSSDNTNYL